MTTRAGMLAFRTRVLGPQVAATSPATPVVAFQDMAWGEFLAKESGTIWPFLTGFGATFALIYSIPISDDDIAESQRCNPRYTTGGGGH